MKVIKDRDERAGRLATTSLTTSVEKAPDTAWVHVSLHSPDGLSRGAHIGSFATSAAVTHDNRGWRHLLGLCV